MDIPYITKAIGIGIFISFMLGPVFFMLIQTSILQGFRAAISFDIGVVLADIVFLYLAYFGSRSILEQIKDNPLLFYIGGAIMIAYGLFMYYLQKDKEILQDKSIVIVEDSNYFQLFIKGFFLNLINVGVLGFWIAMIVIYGAEFKMNGKLLFHFFSIVILAYLATDVGKILLAKKLRNKLTPAMIHKTKHFMGFILIIFGLFLVGKGFW